MCQCYVNQFDGCPPPPFPAFRTLRTSRVRRVTCCKCVFFWERLIIIITDKLNCSSRCFYNQTCPQIPIERNCNCGTKIMYSILGFSACGIKRESIFKRNNYSVYISFNLMFSCRLFQTFFLHKRKSLTNWAAFIFWMTTVLQAVRYFPCSRTYMHAIFAKLFFRTLCLLCPLNLYAAFKHLKVYSVGQNKRSIFWSWWCKTLPNTDFWIETLFIYICGRAWNCWHGTENSKYHANCSVKFFILQPLHWKTQWSDLSDKRDA
jgi:hypothetical protein